MKRCNSLLFTVSEEGTCHTMQGHMGEAPGPVRRQREGRNIG